MFERLVCQIAQKFTQRLRTLEHRARRQTLDLSEILVFGGLYPTSNSH
jgi:hypothetical protein